jgi:hypothetical protein
MQVASAQRHEPFALDLPNVTPATNQSQQGISLFLILDNNYYHMCADCIFGVCVWAALAFCKSAAALAIGTRCLR